MITLCSGVNIFLSRTIFYERCPASYPDQVSRHAAPETGPSTSRREAPRRSGLALQASPLTILIDDQTVRDSFDWRLAIEALPVAYSGDAAHGRWPRRSMALSERG